MKKRVLIFPAGTEIGLELHSALKYSTIFEVWGGTSMVDHSSYVYKNMIYDLPFVTADNFISEINRICDENNIEFIYPAHDSVNLKLAENTDKLSAVLVSSSLKTVDICRDKTKTYEYFKGADFIPKTYNSVEEVGNYPVFIKPRVGQGSVGATKVNNDSELKELLSNGENYVICEYLQGMEYTVDCFTDKNGVLQCARHRDRARIKTGISVNSHVLPKDDKITAIAKEINSKLEFTGAWFFQVKLNSNNEYKLLEASPRIPGTMGVSRNLGINFAQLSLYTKMGYDVDINENNYDITVDRAFINRYKTDLKYSTVYVDLDDTIILNGSDVNSYLMMFLYQCVNNGKKIILLTKHAKTVEETLENHKISLSIFDEIIHISQDENKSHYIKDLDSIFIDDSFSQRSAVAKGSKIPVFDLDNIEALIDWKM